jgi:hypothetical protein
MPNMKPREDFEGSPKSNAYPPITDRMFLTVLLDIRELLIELLKRTPAD